MMHSVGRGGERWNGWGEGMMGDARLADHRLLVLRRAVDMAANKRRCSLLAPQSSGTRWQQGVETTQWEERSRLCSTPCLSQ